MGRFLSRLSFGWCALLLSTRLMANGAASEDAVKDYLKAAESNYTEKDRIVIFDAATNRFVGTLPRFFTTSDRLWVVLVNVDTLRFSYQLQGTMISYQPSQVPSQLNSILFMTPASSTPLPNEALKFVMSVAKPSTPDETARLFEAVTKAFTKLTGADLLNGLASLRDAAELDDSLRRLASTPYSNEQRRNEAARIGKEWIKGNQDLLKRHAVRDTMGFPGDSRNSSRYCKVLDACIPPGRDPGSNWSEGPGSQLSPDVTREFQKISGDIPFALAEGSREFESRYRDFLSAVFAWTVHHQSQANSEKSVPPAVSPRNVAVEALKAAAATLHEDLLKTLAPLEQRFASASALLALMMDGAPNGRTPSVLVRRFSRLSFDEIQLSVGTQLVTLPASGSQKAGSEAGAGQEARSSTLAGGSDFVTQTVRIPVVGCCRVGVSLGLVGTSLVSHHYFVAPPADSSSKPTVGEGPTDKVDLLPAALIQFDNYVSPNVAVGLAVGLTTGSPVRTLAGLSVSLGRKFRGTLTGGVAVGAVPELNGDTVGAAPIAATSVSTTNVVKVGYFVGLSGSFTLP